MKWLILNSDQQSELAAINAKYSDRVCDFFVTTDGIFLTASDKIDDPYWSDYQPLLSYLTPYEGTPTFPQPPEE